MKNLLLAIVMAALALATPWLAWREYSEGAQFVDGATDGQLSVVAEAGDRDYGWTYVFELVGLEVFWIVMALVFWRSFTNQR